MRKILFILLLCSLSVNSQTPDLLLASYQQANSGYSDAITALSPDFYMNNTTIDATATVEADPISTWEDITSNGYDFSQTLTARPELHLDVSEREVTFDGTNDYMQLASGGTADYTLGTNEFTVIIREGDNAGSTGTMLSKAVTTTADRKFQLYKSTNADNIYINTGGTGGLIGSMTGGTDRLIIVVVTTTNFSVYVDGSQVGVTTTLDTTAASHASQPWEVGGRSTGGFLYNGDIDLVAVIPSALDGTQRSSVFTEFQVN